ncbi:MAG: hypothetical protein HKO94_05790 [Flavobacteriaceae bacterium]|nr:hypothetical protein [Flavobacteriaceae bacterium]
MTRKTTTESRLSRRRILPILGSTLLIPFLGLASNDSKEITTDSNEEYEILLRADGKAVKVKKSSIKSAKVVKKGLSNSSLLKWLGKKL